ncbi:tRNA(fMet)-specific endonuclease VapC [Pirellulimonas nuda]|uniref:tRNA(fMet)-specific endonuclease VapC n=1 Tax=Pirellulimonas nuda TaxID=2528009 RepID=A0A518D689_9BACT|nr:type II toxin-antitoxin system VapC family toxin [Pirellulimonas nuda]QDU86985.1 tRNA(fMet)-specific endonuclease VapC [Pirellulimonas nuda]
MPLDVPDGQRCMLDANILYYCFVETAGVSDECRGLLGRVLTGEVDAITSSRALGDCVHKTMLAEVSQRNGRSRERLIGWLKQHPEALADLPKSREVCSRLVRLPLEVAKYEAATLPQVIRIAERHQLLMGDAEIVALMQRHGITHLATNDDDFDRVPGITVWKPRP